MAITIVASSGGPSGGFGAITSFNGNIYGISKLDGTLYEWSGSSSWSAVTSAIGTQTLSTRYYRSLVVFEGNLYAGTSYKSPYNSRLMKWNGSNSWITIHEYDGTNFPSYDFYRGLHLGADGNLYLHDGYPGVGTDRQALAYYDGTIVHDIIYDLSGFNFQNMCNFEGVTYGVRGDGDVFSVTTSGITLLCSAGAYGSYGTELVELNGVLVGVSSPYINSTGRLFTYDTSLNAWSSIPGSYIGNIENSYAHCILGHDQCILLGTSPRSGYYPKMYRSKGTSSIDWVEEYEDTSIPAGSPGFWGSCVHGGKAYFTNFYDDNLYARDNEFTFSSDKFTHTYLRITPNEGNVGSADNWSTSSPFSDYDLSGGEDFFALGTLTTDSFVDTVKVEGKLASLGNINRLVDIFDSIKDNVIEGVGGVAKTNDFSFVIENVTGTVTSSRLIGRRLEVIVGYGSSMLDYDGLQNQRVFTGRIYDVSHERNYLKFSVRGRFQLWNKEIGSLLTGNESTIYKSKIVPISYGDLSDAEAYMPLVLDNDVSKVPLLQLDTQKLSSIDNVVVWDNGSQQAFSAEQGSDVTISADNSSISLSSDNGAYLTESMSSSQSYAKIWDPATVVFEISTPPSPALTPHSVGVTGSVYYDTAKGTAYSYEFIESSEPYYVFTVKGEGFLPTSAPSTLTNGSGSGPASLSFVWSSRYQPSKIQIEVTEEPDPISDIAALAVSAKPSPLILKIDDEYLMAHKSSPVGGSTIYTHHLFKVLRGWVNTTSSAHALESDVSITDGKITTSSWLCKHKFPVNNIANLHWLDVIWDKGGGLVDVVDDVGDMRALSNLQNMLDFSSTGDFSVVEGPIVTPSFSVYDGYLNIYNIDLIFPDVTLQGEISDMFLLGYTKILPFFDSIGNYPRMSICLGKGGKVQPGQQLLTYTTGSDYIFAHSGVGSLVKVSESDPLVYNAEASGLDTNFLFAVSVYNLGLPPYSKISYALNNTGYTINGTPSKDTETAFSLRGSLNTIAKYGAEETFDTNGLIANINELGTTRYFLSLISEWSGPNLATNNGIVAELANLGFLIYFYVDPIKTRFWARGQGRVYNSALTYFNGTGDTLIENPVSVIEDLCRQEIGLTNAELDEATFDAAYAARAGWKAAFSVFGDSPKLFDVLDRIAKQFNLIIGENADGKLTVDTLDLPASLVGLTQIPDSAIVRDSNGVPKWSEAYTSVDKLATALEVNYTENVADPRFTEVLLDTDVVGSSQYTDIAKNIIDEDRKVTVNLDAIRDKNTAKYSIGNVLLYHTSNLRVVEVWVTLTSLASRIGEGLYFESDTYVTGTSNKFYKCIGTSLQLPYRGKNMELKLTLLEKSLAGADDVVRVYTYSSPSVDTFVYDDVSQITFTYDA